MAESIKDKCLFYYYNNNNNVNLREIWNICGENDKTIDYSINFSI